MSETEAFLLACGLMAGVGLLLIGIAVAGGSISERRRWDREPHGFWVLLSGIGLLCVLTGALMTIGTPR